MAAASPANRSSHARTLWLRKACYLISRLGLLQVCRAFRLYGVRATVCLGLCELKIIHTQNAMAHNILPFRCNGSV